MVPVVRVSALDVTDETSSENSGNSEKSDKLLRRGFKNWEERCLAHGGRAVLEQYLTEQEDLIYCLMQQFDLQEINSEIERNKKSGDLDDVLKKYCNVRVPAARDCLASFIRVSSECLEEERDQAGLNISQQMVDTAIEFLCHRDGDRIDLFLSEGGAECVTSHYEEILSCVNKSVPEILRANSQPRQRSRIHFYVFQQQNCRKGDAIMSCVERSLLQCPDPTPANLVQAMLQAVRDVTTCTTSTAQSRPVSVWPVTGTLLLLLCTLGTGQRL